MGIETGEKALDTRVFPEEKPDSKRKREALTIGQRVLIEIVADIGNISIGFFPREEFDSKRGDILEKRGDGTYKLILTDDLSVDELAHIIYKINQATFGENIPEYASSNELKTKIKFILFFLGEIKNKDENIKNSISKYKELYIQLGGNATDLSSDNLKKIGENKEYETKLILIKTKNSLAELANEMDKLLKEELENHFREAFFEGGVNMLRLGMMTITKTEQDSLEEISNEKVIIEKRVSSHELDEKETLLREKIGIDKLKKELQDVRESGDERLIQQKERDVANTILEYLYQYPYQLDSSNDGYKPKEILDKKQVFCIGLSILGHAFLSELGIKHRGLDGRLNDKYWHSAIELEIGGDSYYFDPALNNNIVNFDFGKGDTTYKKIHIGRNELLLNSGNPEKIILAQVYNSKGYDFVNESKIEEASKMFERAIDLNPNYATAHLNMGYSLMKLGISEINPNEQRNLYYRSLEELTKVIDLVDYDRAYVLGGEVLYKLRTMKINVSDEIKKKFQREETPDIEEKHNDTPG